MYIKVQYILLNVIKERLEGPFSWKNMYNTKYAIVKSMLQNIELTKNVLGAVIKGVSLRE